MDDFSYATEWGKRQQMPDTKAIIQIRTDAGSDPSPALRVS